MYKNKDKIVKEHPSRYFKAYLNEVKNDETGELESHVKTLFSKKPFTPEQFTSLIMGVMEAYAEQLLTTNKKEDVYEHFNNAFGIFLTKLVPADYIYKHDKAHKKLKKRVDDTLGQPEDSKANEDNRLAAYILCRDILTTEIGLTEESADLLLNKRLGLLQPADTTGAVGDVKIVQTEAKE